MRSALLPSGVGSGLDPGGRNGRSPCRRPGGPAPKRWQRRPCRSPVTPRTQPRSRRASTGGDRPPSEQHPATGRPGDLRPPNRERCRSGSCAGGQRGRGPPPASAGDSRSVAPRSKLAALGRALRNTPSGTAHAGQLRLVPVESRADRAQTKRAAVAASGHRGLAFDGEAVTVHHGDQRHVPDSGPVVCRVPAQAANSRAISVGWSTRPGTTAPEAFSSASQARAWASRQTSPASHAARSTPRTAASEWWAVETA